MRCVYNFLCPGTDRRCKRSTWNFAYDRVSILERVPFCGDIVRTSKCVVKKQTRVDHFWPLLFDQE